jgi:hypothetical protein
MLYVHGAVSKNRDHGGELDIPGEELGHAILDLVLSHKLRSAEVETLDLLGTLREVGPVEHGGLLGNTAAHLHTQTTTNYYTNNTQN